MSTDYITTKEIHVSELLDGRLKRFGIHELIVPDTTSECERCLTDGNSNLWMHLANEGSLWYLTWDAASGAPDDILGAIADLFETKIYSEYQYQYWGFETPEEMGKWLEEVGNKHDEFRADVFRYLRGKAHGIVVGTIGEIKADIAKSFVEANPSLLNVDNHDELFRKVDEIYRNDPRHSVTDALTKVDIATAELMVTHEDDLPKA
jgi:hypothetical protein